MRWTGWILMCLMPARADDTVSACGQACPSRGIELVVVEEPVKLTGFTVEQLSEQWTEALQDLRYATPHLSGWAPCLKCGSPDVLDSVSLRYELTVPLPTWDEPASLSDADRLSVRKWMGAVQGHVYRHVAAHRDAVDAVTVRNHTGPQVRAMVNEACKRALQADEALDASGGCIRGTTLGGLTVEPIKACQPRYKPTPPALCQIED